MPSEKETPAMSSPSWLKRLHSASPNRHARRARSPLPPPRTRRPTFSVETLDDRILPGFLSPVDYVTGAYPEAIVSADFNGDGKLDLAVANYGDSNVSVLLGNGDGTFQDAQNSATSWYPLSLAVGDFNEDGKLDLGTANAYDVSVLLGNGDGTFQAPTNLSVAAYPSSVAVGDFTGDGKLDLGVTSNYYYYWYGYYGYANVLVGNGEGDFSGPAITWLGYGYQSGTTAADLDGDSIDELVTLNADWSQLNIFKSDISGNLAYSAGYSTGYYPWSVSAGDMDGAGGTDLVTANFWGNSVDVLLGDGAGGFTGAGSFDNGGSAGAVMIGDFTGDGQPDVAATSYSSDEVNVLYGTGAGTLSPPAHFATGSGPFSAASGDFNGDGALDVATGNYNGGGVSVLLNDNNLPWPPPPPPPPPTAYISDAWVTEGNTGTKDATFTISLSKAYFEDVTIHFETADSSAVAGSDYIAASGDVTIPAGETSVEVKVAVKGDRLVEPNENFLVNLSNPVNATLGNDQAIGNIVDDEPRVSINDVSHQEGNGNGKNANTLYIFTISLSTSYDEAVTVNFSTADGTATLSNSDYIAASGSVTFAVGETTKTVTVTVKGDKTREPDEYFALNLTSSSTNAFLLDTQGIGWILDDDTHGNGKGKP